jgi:hypothetical protein
MPRGCLRREYFASGVSTAFQNQRSTAQQPFIFQKKKTYTSPPMVGTPMQFP